MRCYRNIGFTVHSRFPITLEWNGKVIKEKVYWFQYETDVTMNSNVFEVAQALVQKHFPGLSSGLIQIIASLLVMIET